MDSQSDSQSSGSEQQPWWHTQFEEMANPADVSNAAQEAVRLAAAVASWANDTGLSSKLQEVVEQTSGGLRSAVRAATGDATGGSEDQQFDCQSCPICQGMLLVEDLAPDAVPGLTSALDSLTAAVLDTADLLARRTGEETAVQHIRID